jgi:ribose/xylose/arabinose/galactoside ABC-type transport system permease subunit
MVVVIHDAWRLARGLVLAPGVLLALAWLLVVAAFAAQLPFFLTVTNAVTIVNFSVVTFIVAAGFTIVLIGGGLDLSVGSALMVAGVTAAVAFRAGAPLVVAFAFGFAMGPVAGLINGLLVVRLRINPLIATLSMLFVLRAVGFWVTGSRLVQIRDDGFRFARELVFGLPVAVYFLIVTFILSWVLLRWTKLGRHISAIGGNPQAARQTAMNVERYRLGIYVLAGAYSGLAGILLASILGAADPNAGTGREFAVATAVFLGGASLSGGRGSIVGTLVGVLFITTMANGLTQLGAFPEIVLILNGVLLIAAVAFDQRPKGGYR